MKDFLAHAEEAGSGWGGLAYQAMLTSATNTDDESLVIDEKLNTINDLINTGGNSLSAMDQDSADAFQRGDPEPIGTHTNLHV